MSQIASVITFADTGSNATVNGTRLNSHVNDAALLNGSILDQTEKTLPVSADTLLLGDSTVAASGYPKKVQLGNLLLESQRNGTQQYVASDTGSASAYAVALSPAATAYTAGMVVRFKAGNASTGASTINVNTLGVKTIKNRAGADLAANDILAGQIVTLVYDGSYFQLESAISASQITATMMAEAARNGTGQYAGTSTGSANTQAGTITPTPTALSAGMVVRFKAGYTNTGAVTFNCGYGGAVAIKKIVAGTLADLKAKDIQVADIVTLVYDGTYWVLAGHVRSWDFVSGGTDSIPGSSTKVDVAHSLGAVPTKVRVVLVNTGSAELGYATNDELEYANFGNSSNLSNAFAVSADATNVTISQLNQANIEIIPKAGGAYAGITETQWKFKVYASL